MRTVLSGAILFLFAVASAHAQSIDGRLVESASEDPVAGALVQLIPEGRDAPAASSISRADGRFSLQRIPPGRYLLRAQRIGYAPATESVVMEADSRVEILLSLALSAVRLEAITVGVERRCAAHPSRGPEMALLWEAARSAFEGALETAAERSARFHLLRYQRDLEPSHLRVETEQQQLRTLWGDNPIHSIPAERLSAEGYVHEDPNGDVYYAPDATALLSDVFLEDHCFRVAEDPEAPDMIGLAFEPIRGRRLPDIEGTLWVDRRTAELRRLDFVYVNLPYRIRSDHIGGQVAFERIATGAWIIPSWWIRMPTLALRRSAGPRDFVIEGYRQVGGEIRDVRIAGEEHLLARTGSGGLSGRVRDDLGRGAALAGARVFLPGTPHSATASADGTFRIDGVPAGIYGISFDHPRLDSLAADPPYQEVVVAADSTSEITLSLSEDLLPRCMPEITDPRGGPVRVMGYVREARTGTAIPGARVSVSFDRWGVRDHGGPVTVAREQRGAWVETDDEGRYLICGLPDRTTIRIAAELLGGEIATGVADSGHHRMVRHDLTAELARTIRVRGQVVDATTGAPVASAALELEGTEHRTLTDSRGRWSLEEVPADRHTIAIRHLAYGTRHHEALLAEEGADVEIRLGPSAIALEPVVVTGRSHRDLAARMSGTRYEAITRTDIEEIGRTAMTAMDAVRRRFPSLEVSEATDGSGFPVFCVQDRRGQTNFRGGCREMVLYVDGVQVAMPSAYLERLRLDEVESVEYIPPVEAGPRYGSNSAHGVLVVHTRGNGPHARN